jgi:hypothetical protein
MTDQAEAPAAGLKSPSNIEAKSRSWVVVVVTGLIAAAAPLTAAVYGSISKSKELAIAAKEQDFKMRMSFLDHAIESGRPAEDRRLVLRFLRATMRDDASLSSWANSELQSVEDELNKTKRERDDALRGAAQSQKATEKAEQELIVAKESEANARQELESKNVSEAETRKRRQAFEVASNAREEAERKLARTKATGTAIILNDKETIPTMWCFTVSRTKSDGSLEKDTQGLCERETSNFTRISRYEATWTPDEAPAIKCRCSLIPSPGKPSFAPAQLKGLGGDPHVSGDR